MSRKTTTPKQPSSPANTSDGEHLYRSSPRGTYREQMSTVYVLRAKGTNLCKIGFTAGDVEERRRALQTGCPHELVVELAFEGTVEDERRVHAIHHEQRLVGEWFDLAEDRVKLIPHFIEREREWEAMQNAHAEVTELRARFVETFGRGHEDGYQYRAESILLFCETIAESAFDPRMNGQSNLCLHCQVASPPLELGPFDEAELRDAVLGNNDENLGHAVDCPVPWLLRAAEAIRRGRP